MKYKYAELDKRREILWRNGVKTHYSTNSKKKLKMLRKLFTFLLKCGKVFS